MGYDIVMNIEHFYCYDPIYSSCGLWAGIIKEYHKSQSLRRYRYALEVSAQIELHDLSFETKLYVYDG